MAQAIQVSGYLTIKVGTGSGGALETLTTGGLRNGAQLVFESFFGDVPADIFGGEEGPPIDTQYFGEICRIALVLSKWDAAIANKLAVRTRGGSDGIQPTSGGLMAQDSLFYRLLIQSTGDTFNFPTAVFREPIEINKGTKHSTLIIPATAYAWSGNVLFDTQTA